MTVKELIEKLHKVPNDMEIKIMASYDDGFGTAVSLGGEIQCIVKEDADHTIYLCNDNG